MLSLHYLGGRDPQAHLAAEERLFEALRAEPAPHAMFYINAPCVILGRSNEAAVWANGAHAVADGVPVLRRFSGGGAVYQDERVLNYSFLLPKSLIVGRGVNASPQGYIDLFRSMVIGALAPLGGAWTAGGISDILLNGRKVSGNAQRLSSTLVLHHGTLLLECPLAEIERYLPVPPNRPGVAHRGFVTGLREEGLALSPALACLMLVQRLRSWLTGTC
jgi:lipoate---protein ligase